MTGSNHDIGKADQPGSERGCKIVGEFPIITHTEEERLDGLRLIGG